MSSPKEEKRGPMELLPRMKIKEFKWGSFIQGEKAKRMRIKIRKMRDKRVEGVKTMKIPL